MLFHVRVEINDNENDVVARRRYFPVEKNRIIVGLIETQVVFKLKRAVRLSNLVQSRDPVLNVSRPVPVALFILILFRVGIFLATWQCLVLAKFVATIDPVDG